MTGFPKVIPESMTGDIKLTVCNKVSEYCFVSKNWGPQKIRCAPGRAYQSMWPDGHCLMGCVAFKTSTNFLSTWDSLNFCSSSVSVSFILWAKSIFKIFSSIFWVPSILLFRIKFWEVSSNFLKLNSRKYHFLQIFKIFHPSTDPTDERLL